MIVDLFAGPGGWDVGADMAGLVGVVGIEVEHDPWGTGIAAGHARILEDVSALDPLSYSMTGLIASPPCQGFSTAGLGRGRSDAAELVALVDSIADNPTGAAVDAAIRHARRWLDADDALFRPAMDDPRSHLALEPLRWALYGRPAWIALEQVPAVMPLWEATARVLERVGYSTAVEVIRAEQYGVPQTRRRAVLVARDALLTAFYGPVDMPRPTHSRYYPEEPWRLDHDVLPWVSMADALGWQSADVVGFPRQADTADAVTIDGTDYRARDLRPASHPAQTVTEKGRSWTRWAVPPQRRNDQTGDPETDWAWPERRPATTIAGRGLVTNPGTNANRFNNADKSRNDGVRVTVAEAALLQTFPADYPFRGSQSSQYQQIGDAMPPRLAAAILGHLVRGD